MIDEKTIDAKTLTSLVSFVEKAFPLATDDTGKSKGIYREKALASAKRLFLVHSLSLAPLSETKQKGAKTVSHNANDDTYIRAQAPKCSCPIVLKPIWNKGSFLAFVLVPDNERVKSHDELESFVKLFEPKAYAKHEDYVLLSVACTSRQIGEDRRNNSAQRLIRMESSLKEQEQKISGFVAMPDNIWNAAKDAIALSFDPDDRDDILSLIDEKRRALKASPAVNA